MSHDEVQHRDGEFVIERHGQRVAELTYRRAPDGTRFVIDHTEVDPSLRGQGVARRLLDAAVAWARASGQRIVPSCPYARAEFARDASLHDVLAR
jgi:hypothetical protein